MALLFPILVVLGFLFQVLACLPGGPTKWPYWTLAAWLVWLIASIIWALGATGHPVA